MRSKYLQLIVLLVLTTLSCKALQSPAVQGTPEGPSPTEPAALLIVTQAAPTATTSPTPAPTITETPTPTFLPPTPTSGLPAFQASSATSNKQQNVFQALWELIESEYLYPDFNGLDWETIHAEYSQKIQQGLSDKAFYEAMYEMVYRLDDDHSSFFSPEEAAETNAEYAGESQFVGIGVLSETVPERQRVVIILVYPGSPAEQAGLKMHDSILAADGTPILDEAGERRDILRGLEGSVVTLTVQSPGKPVREVQVTRRKINGSAPVPYSLLQTASGKRIGYLFLTTFHEVSVSEKVEAALRELSRNGPLDGIILDNRHNEGGADVVMIDTLSYFTSGQVGSFINRKEEFSVQVDPVDIAGSQTVPLVVLVGPETVSFGEIFAGILQDRSEAHLIGETTPGNVEILYVYDFEDGSQAWIAHDIFQPSNHPDSNWEENGIIPDLMVPVDWDLITPETDPAIAASLDYFEQNEIRQD